VPPQSEPPNRDLLDFISEELDHRAAPASGTKQTWLPPAGHRLLSRIGTR